jgi:hypothetical protein
MELEGFTGVDSPRFCATDPAKCSCTNFLISALPWFDAASIQWSAFSPRT